jgi:hypothetical protein
MHLEIQNTGGGVVLPSRRLQAHGLRILGFRFEAADYAGCFLLEQSAWDQTTAISDVSVPSISTRPPASI